MVKRTISLLQLEFRPREDSEDVENWNLCSVTNRRGQTTFSFMYKMTNWSFTYLAVIIALKQNV